MSKKSCKSALKRFKKNGKNCYKFKKTGKRHLLTKKSSKKKRIMSRFRYLSSKPQIKLIKELIV